MKTVLLLLFCGCVVFTGICVSAETYVEEEFIVQGDPVYTEPVTPVQTTTVVAPGAAVVTTTPGFYIVPGEESVYLGMNKYHAKDLLGEPAYVERFKKFTQRHHGVYDEVWTYSSPAGNLVLYIKEGRIERIGHE